MYISSNKNIYSFIYFNFSHHICNHCTVATLMEQPPLEKGNKVHRATRRYCAKQDQAGPSCIAFLRSSVRMLPVTFLSPPLPLPNFPPSCRPAFALLCPWLRSCRHQNSVRRCGRGQRPLLDPVVPNGALSWV